MTFGFEAGDNTIEHRIDAENEPQAVERMYRAIAEAASVQTIEAVKD